MIINKRFLPKVFNIQCLNWLLYCYVLLPTTVQFIKSVVLFRYCTENSFVTALNVWFQKSLFLFFHLKKGNRKVWKAKSGKYSGLPKVLIVMPNNARQTQSHVTRDTDDIPRNARSLCLQFSWNLCQKSCTGKI